MIDSLIEQNLKLQARVIDLENAVRLHHFNALWEDDWQIENDKVLWKLVDNGIICSDDTAKALKTQSEALKANSDNPQA